MGSVDLLLDTVQYDKFAFFHLFKCVFTRIIASKFYLKMDTNIL